MSLDAPLLLFTFDDVSDTIYSEAFSYMQTKGVKGTAYMISDNIDAGGYLTAANLLEMQAAGWVIGNHSKTHAHLTSLTEVQQEAELDGCRDALAALGITTGDHVAYPYGESDANTLLAMVAQGMKTGGTVVSGGFSLPPSNKYLLNRTVIVNTTTLAQARAAIDTAISNRQILIITFHTLVVSASTTYEWVISDFQALVNYVVAMGYPTGTIVDLNNRL